MKTSFKILRNLLIIITFGIIIAIYILHIHGMLAYLDLKTTWILLSHGINIFKLEMLADHFGPNYFSPSELELLVLELTGQLD